MSPAAETPMAFVHAIRRAYARHGQDAGPALQAAGISGQLRQVRVTARQFEAFTAIAMRELDDEALGWFSRRLPWGTNGMLCRAALPSATLGIALKRWCRHYALVVQDIALRLTVEDGVARLQIHEHVNLGRQREFCLVSILRSIHGFACWLIDSRIRLTRTGLPYRQPAHAGAYALMFPGTVQFACGDAHVEFDAGYLSLPVRRQDDDLRRMLLRPLPLIVHAYRRDRLLSQRLGHLLRAEGLVSADAQALAAELHVSSRTLHRHLADEGTSLQQIKNAVRRDIALQWLTTSREPIKRVAGLAGFRNEASFSRAFRQWMGQSPGEYREARRATTISRTRVVLDVED